MSYIHECKYFIFNTKTEFEPSKFKDTDGNMLYKRVEYAFSGCSYGKALKTAVKGKELG